MATSTTLILGGGFGGISTANTLRGLLPPEHEIVVIDRTDRFHVGAGKTWLMLGTRTFPEISQSRAELLAPGVRFVQAVVQRLDVPNRSVTTEAGSLRWDHLVIALGAQHNLSAIPGLAEASFTFYNVEAAQRLGAALDEFRAGEIAILIPRTPFSCPPAPYEAAMLLQLAFERRGLGERVRLAIHTVEGAPMPTAGPEMGRFIVDELARRGIGFHPLRQVARVDVATRSIRFEDGSDARYDLLIAIPPHEAPAPVRDAGLTNLSGWIPVEPGTLRVKAGPEAPPMYAVGDVATVPLPGRFKPDMALALPKAGVFAEAQGRVVAHQIAAAVLGRDTGEAFDGKGFCFIETGGDLAVRGDGAFFELPHPVMSRRAPDADQFHEKVEWVKRHLEPIR